MDSANCMNRPIGVTAVSSSINSHCPTVTSVGSACTECTTLACLQLSTISNPCDCPTVVPTVTAHYGCNGEPCPAGCSTSYLYATSTSTCTPATTETPEPTSLAVSCTYRPTQTIYSTSGCANACDTSQFCIIDGMCFISSRIFPIPSCLSSPKSVSFPMSFLTPGCSRRDGPMWLSKSGRGAYDDNRLPYIYRLCPMHHGLGFLYRIAKRLPDRYPYHYRV
ncbi:hypothetical protein GQ53DRAFT_451236 [Thozetella sp. PMI_491]|nr:hypothetical protein GQ53DRAFT_451236 [Thozetella sp. PMI_491]